jgi:hypothetical protein
VSVCGVCVHKSTCACVYVCQAWGKDGADREMYNVKHPSTLRRAGYAEEEAEDMFAVVDADGSGAIQLDEFTDWYQAMVAKASNMVVDRPPTLLDSLLDWSSSSSSSSSASSQQDTDERLHTLESLSSRSKRRDT